MVAFYMKMLDIHAKVVMDRSAELKYFSSAIAAQQSTTLPPVYATDAAGRRPPQPPPLRSATLNETIASWIVDNNAVLEETRLRKHEVKQIAARQKWNLLHAQFREFLRYHFDHLRNLQVRSYICVFSLLY
jgi:hypothetical protein